jgi:diaminopimelate epimerase
VSISGLNNVNLDLKAPFWKFHGTGNDFIVVDNREELFNHLSQEYWAACCHRRFGIGADGILLLQEKNDSWHMGYLNSDGNPSSFCGNGSRCFAAFCHSLGLVALKEPLQYHASDGPHTSWVHLSEGRDFVVETEMRNCSFPQIHQEGMFVDTGSPHWVVFHRESPEHMPDFEAWAKSIRNSTNFLEAGVNVNLVYQNQNELHMRTYERSVEAETWSCGTGTVAAALCSEGAQSFGSHERKVYTKGGQLSVSFDTALPSGFRNIRLKGSAVCVFKGFLEV